MRWADLRQASLYQARLTAANLEEANLRGCRVQGIFGGDLNLAGAHQENLIITQREEPVIAVDDLEMAQILDLLLHKNREVRAGINANIVLIVGHFVPGRRGILEALRQGLRQRYYLPVLLDFEETLTRFKEQVSLLARLARFAIVDLTSPAVLQGMPDLINNFEIPVVPLWPAGHGQGPQALDLLRQSRLFLLKTCFYQDPSELSASLEERVIAPAEEVRRKSLGQK